MEFHRKSVINQTKVSLTIAKKLFSIESDKNIVFSPLSLQVVLSMIAAGSEGPTKQQLLDFLRSESTDHLNSLASHLLSIVLTDAAPAGGPRLSFVDGLWVEETLSLMPSFKKVVTTDYKATVSFVDLMNKHVEVANDVNLWVEKETNGLIKDILPPWLIEPPTKLIFANSLYFKGVWDQQFNTLKTKDYDFHLLNGSSIKVPFMTNNKEDQYIGAFDGFKILRLPYKHGQDDRRFSTYFIHPDKYGQDCRFSMYFILPDAKDGLSALVEKVAFESELLHQKLGCLYQEKVGDFRIPRFNVSFGFEASNMLKELGVVLPFEGGGLTKMVDSQDVFVSRIILKSFIEVNEKGTEAAAATIAICRGFGVCSPRPRLDFVADHPFLFLIREDLTGTILFVGQILNPLVG